MGAKPPVMKLVMASHRPWKKARTGSMPFTASTRASTTVATRMKPRAILVMKRVVWTTLGITCSLRPSEA